MDNDGDLDVLGAAFNDDDITWWENSDTGLGIYWTEHTDLAIFLEEELFKQDGITVSAACWWTALKVTFVALKKQR